jgi:serine/threonine protein kinase
MLVRHKKTDKRFVAKKMVLEGLSDKELDGCKNETNLLRNLSHPNIVGYIENYLTKDYLIIIMEYCEGKQSKLFNNLF